MSFSQRKGLKPLEKILQIEAIDNDLKNGLWNTFHICFWSKFRSTLIYTSTKYTDDSNLSSLFNKYWTDYFKTRIDTLPEYFNDAKKIVREYFYKAEWNEVYDFVEFSANNGPDDLNKSFIRQCNIVLEKENSAYRFVDSILVEISSEEEIESIEDAFQSVSKYSGIKAHLNSAISMLADRKKPNYRNSIKESISAVEAISQLITGDKKATLGKAIKVLEKEGLLHNALKSSFSSLYGYTSNSDGIRHAMLEESTLTFIDAKYMLVACTAFINYVLGKAAELNLEFEKLDE